MALTAEILKANQNLSGLTDEQIATITQLSTNDENTVIGSRIGEIYRNMDATIKSATGVERNGDEKTYNYLERAAKALADKAANADKLGVEVASLQKEKSRLEKALAEGAGDEETKKALSQAQKDLKQTIEQFNTLKTEFDTAKKAHESELFNVRIDNVIQGATSGIKFKTELPNAVTDVILKQTIEKVKGMNPEFIDDGKGGKMLAFKDENGGVLRNPENKLEPYTASDLITKELKGMDVLEVTKNGGTGTKPKPGGGSGSLTISGARTQNEAFEAIAAELMAKGLVNGSDEFQAEMSKAWTENNVSALPLN